MSLVGQPEAPLVPRLYWCTFCVSCHRSSWRSMAKSPARKPWIHDRAAVEAGREADRVIKLQHCEGPRVFDPDVDTSSWTCRKSKVYALQGGSCWLSRQHSCNCILPSACCRLEAIQRLQPDMVASLNLLPTCTSLQQQQRRSTEQLFPEDRG